MPTTAFAPVESAVRDSVARGRLRAAVVGPALALGLLALLGGTLHGDPGGKSSLLCWLAVSVVATTAGVAAYLAWRLDTRPGLAWVAAALVLVGLHGTGTALLALARLGTGEPPVAGTLTDVVAAASAAALGLAAARATGSPRHPLLLGAAAAVVLVALRALVPGLPAGSPGDPSGLLLAAAVLVPAALGAAGVATGRVPSHLRSGLAAALLAGAAPWPVLATVAALRGDGWPWFGAGALVVVVTATVHVLHGLRALDREREKSLQVLTARASRAEAAARHNQDRMHEIRATAAGVASAAEVLAHRQLELSAARRQTLCELLVDETERLRRLTHSFERGEVTRVDLDEVVGRVVGKQRALGQVVRWEPSGLAVEADADMLQEVLDILLVNAQVHAPGAWVRVNARLRHGAAVVQVRDTGPGVSPQVADRLFDRGVRGPSSSGSGVGLHLARRLAAEMGGTLRLEPTQTGTRFVLSLTPHAEGVTHDAVEPGQHPDARGAC